MIDDKTPDIPIASMLKRSEAKILIVEDDKFLRNILVGRFKQEGYTVLEAEDGEIGMSLTEKEKPHLVLLDITLPGKMNGFDYLSEVRAKPKIAETLVMVLSNQSSPEFMERADSLGAKDYLVKANNTPQEIVDRVRKLLEKHSLKR
ncbi:MAG: response regulator [bacterium]|nr:response regulator [bacterium]